MIRKIEEKLAGLRLLCMTEHATRRRLNLCEDYQGYVSSHQSSDINNLRAFSGD